MVHKGLVFRVAFKIRFPGLEEAEELQACVAGKFDKQETWVEFFFRPRIIIAIIIIFIIFMIIIIMIIIVIIIIIIIIIFIIIIIMMMILQATAT